MHDNKTLIRKFKQHHNQPYQNHLHRTIPKASKESKTHFNISYFHEIRSK